MQPWQLQWGEAQTRSLRSGWTLTSSVAGCCQCCWWHDYWSSWGQLLCWQSPVSQGPVTPGVKEKISIEFSGNCQSVTSDALTDATGNILIILSASDRHGWLLVSRRWVVSLALRTYLSLIQYSRIDCAVSSVQSLSGYKFTILLSWPGTK